MKPEDILKQQADRACRTYKPQKDFLHRLRKQDTFKKQAQEKPPTQADHVISQALMVWDDDGGASGNSACPNRADESGKSLEESNGVKQTNEQSLIIREKK